MHSSSSVALENKNRLIISPGGTSSCSSSSVNCCVSKVCSHSVHLIDLSRKTSQWFKFKTCPAVSALCCRSRCTSSDVCGYNDLQRCLVISIRSALLLFFGCPVPSSVRGGRRGGRGGGGGGGGSRGNGPCQDDDDACPSLLGVVAPSGFLRMGDLSCPGIVIRKRGYGILYKRHSFCTFDFLRCLTTGVLVLLGCRLK